MYQRGKNINHLTVNEDGLMTTFFDTSPFNTMTRGEKCLKAFNKVEDKDKIVVIKNETFNICHLTKKVVTLYLKGEALQSRADLR